ncbi:unnamed protein product [uncultured bacterium]|nr:unnamed protein product [uncultured bacterium]
MNPNQRRRLEKLEAEAMGRVDRDQAVDHFAADMEKRTRELILMEQVRYNGVQFDVVQTLRCHRQSMRDAGQNYMIAKHEIEILSRYQPAMASYVTQVPNKPNPASAPLAPLAQVAGKLPGETDLATLNRLLAPRGLLTVIAGGQTILETPGLNPISNRRYPCDVANGPFCEFVSVPQQIGFRDWLVHLRFVAQTCRWTSRKSRTRPACRAWS